MSSPKPVWLKVAMPTGQGYFGLKRLLRENNLHTVCEEADCPNIAECFGKRTATFMILGDTCTRDCRYCAVEHGSPDAPNPEEPKGVAEAVRKLGLKYVVITSVTRDDLRDGGAGQFAEVVRRIKDMNLGCKIELLIPDLRGNKDSLNTIMESEPDVLNHNIEVVKRLFPKVRPDGSYKRSLELLSRAKGCSVKCSVKTGFMVGLGETRKEIIETMNDLSGLADIITIGQYLQPTKGHWPVSRYYAPEEFRELKELGEEMGFEHIESGPLVRSSYHAGDYGV
jgi:lipoic acid synthetase